MEEFVSTVAGRTKEQLPSLAVLVGWAAAVGANRTPRFNMAFVEELWRRNFTAYYKGQPREPIMETLEKLLYGPVVAEGDDDSGGEEGSLARNIGSKDKEFALWARYQWRELSKKQTDELRRKYSADSQGKVVGPKVEGLRLADGIYKERVPLNYDDAAEFFDAVIEAELLKIRRANAFLAALYNGISYGEGFDPSERRMILIQALQFVGNDAMSQGITSGSYLNTFDCLLEANGAARICGQLHERFEQHRREKLSACVEQRNCLITARRIVGASDLDAFAGRCFVSCPTRGGLVFECVVSLLAACGGGDHMTEPAVPHLREKVAAVLTGKVGERPVIADGSSWVHCSLDTAQRLRVAVGEEAFMKIELAMHGTWGHVYRSSDIPNRHGHCNSNPNKGLVQCFSGFHLGGA